MTSILSMFTPSVLIALLMIIGILFYGCCFPTEDKAEETSSNDENAEKP
jgi:predicted DNA repair protein MutK